jgi:hypothetical protein
VCPTLLIKFDQGARVKGDLQDKVNRYTQQFLGGVPQEAPISVVPLNGGYVVKDGVTRGRGKQGARVVDATQKVLVSDFHHDRLSYGADEWEDFQDKSNDHLGETENSEADMKHAVEKRILSARLDHLVKAANGGTPVDYDNDLSEYAKVGGRWFKDELFTNSGKTWVWFSNRIKDTLAKAGKLTTSIDTYTAADLQKLYVDTGGTNYAGIKGDFKHISGNERVFVLRNNGRWHPNLGGSLTGHLRNSPNTDYTILIAYDRVAAKEDSDIVADRAATVKEVKEIVALYKAPCIISVKSAKQTPADKNGITEHWTNKPKTILRHALKTV